MRVGVLLAMAGIVWGVGCSEPERFDGAAVAVAKGHDGGAGSALEPGKRKNGDAPIFPVEPGDVEDLEPDAGDVEDLEPDAGDVEDLEPDAGDVEDLEPDAGDVEDLECHPSTGAICRADFLRCGLCDGSQWMDVRSVVTCDGSCSELVCPLNVDGWGTWNPSARCYE